MKGSRDPDGSLPAELIAEAASWCARMDQDRASTESDPAFRGWLADDPRRRAAFDALSQTMNDPALIEASREVDDACSRDSQHIEQSSASESAEPWSQTHPRSIATTRARTTFGAAQWRASVAAGLVLIVAAWFIWPALELALTPQTIVSAVPGQTREVTLNDGSRVELSGGTSLQVRFSSGRRMVRMEQGEAFFTVTPDPDRPFIVEAADGRVEVRGTAFDLSQTGDGLEVAVHHGRVAFGRTGFFAHQVELVAGERAEVSSGVVSAIKHFDIDAGDWRTGWLETDGITLAGLAERLNRRHNVVIDVDPALADKRIAGRFRLNDPEVLLRRLSTLHGFAVTRGDEGGLAIRPRAADI